VALLDAGYGANTDLRANITTLGLWYVAGIMPNTTVWAPVQFPPSALPDGYRPRGSAPASRTAHSELNRNRAPTTD
jgi:SRSO17 transposase